MFRPFKLSSEEDDERIMLNGLKNRTLMTNMQTMMRELSSMASFLSDFLVGFFACGFLWETTWGAGENDDEDWDESLSSENKDSPSLGDDDGGVFGILSVLVGL